MSVWVMISTAASVRKANRMARELVGGKLAACVNVFSGVTSHFFWEGKLAKEKEAMILVKTTKANAGKVLEKIREIHTYQLPEVLFFEAAGGEKKYLDWVKRSVEGKKQKNIDKLSKKR